MKRMQLANRRREQSLQPCSDRWAPSAHHRVGLGAGRSVTPGRRRGPAPRPPLLQFRAPTPAGPAPQGQAPAWSRLSAAAPSAPEGQGGPQVQATHAPAAGAARPWRWRARPRATAPAAASCPATGKPLVDTPQAVTVVPQQVMEEQKATTVRDALRNVSGITISAGEGGRQGDTFILRGFSGPERHVPGRQPGFGLVHARHLQPRGGRGVLRPLLRAVRARLDRWRRQPGDQEPRRRPRSPTWA